MWPYNRGGLITEVASLQGGNLVVFYYVSASDVWPNNRGDLSWGGQFTIILPTQCIWNLAWLVGGIWLDGSYKKGTTV